MKIHKPFLEKLHNFPCIFDVFYAMYVVLDIKYDLLKVSCVEKQFVCEQKGY